VSETVLIPGGRDVRATLDTAASDGGGDATGNGSRADAVVVACPPHPQQRGHRGDERLTAVSNALTDRGSTAFGSTTVTGTKDTARALTPTTRSAGRSSGTSASGCSASRSGDGRARHGGVPPRTRRGLRARADRATEPRRGRSCGPRRSYRSSVPTRILYATRDSTADWEPVVERAKELGIETIGFESDHFFVGRAGDVGRKWGRFSGRD